MFSSDLDEDETRRVATFFVDSMATSTTEEVGEEEAMAVLRSIWSDGSRIGVVAPAVSEEYLTGGFVRIAVAMAHMVVHERRAGGQLEASVSDVWGDLQTFMTSL
jgi:hypothetical protein